MPFVTTGRDEGDELRAIEASNKLRTLSFSGEALGDAGARMVGAAIASCASLETLLMCRVSISSRGLRVLAPALGSCSSLRVLDLSHNRRVGPSGALALARALAKATAATIKVYASDHPNRKQKRQWPRMEERCNLKEWE